MSATDDRIAFDHDEAMFGPQDAEPIAATLTPEAADEYTCECGNRSDLSGFDNCLTDGTPVEPEIGSGWVDLYACRDCGSIIRITSAAQVSA